MSDDFSLWDVVISMFWFMLLLTWIWMIIAIMSDIFRDRELKGGAKALWTLFIVVAPWLGALIYLIVRGESMGARQQQMMVDRGAAMSAYATSGAGSPSVSDELRELVDLRDSGIITAAEYEQAKVKVLT